MMNYKGTTLKDIIKISSIYSIHYLEYFKGYEFTGESHDFWEFVCVDKGEVIAETKKGEFLLKTGDIIFHKPNEWHNIRTNTNCSANVVIISFSAKKFPDDFFCEALLKVNRTQKLLLSKILDEVLNSFSTPIGDPYTYKLELKTDCSPAAKQLIKLYITEFLLLFLHNESKLTRVPMQRPIDNNTFASAIDFMNDNISTQLRLEDIAHHLNISVSSLKLLFRKNVQRGVIDYFNYLKMEVAKEYIRMDRYTFTEIASLLGYSNLYYFSFQFKKIIEMSPSEYKKSIKSMFRI